MSSSSSVAEAGGPDNSALEFIHHPPGQVEIILQAITCSTGYVRLWQLGDLPKLAAEAIDLPAAAVGGN